VASLAKSKENGKETREFARKHVEEAGALIDAVNFRRQRILEVARAITEKQRDFFDVGPSGLKVLRMSDLAAELSCDPSTVSRTVADKYLQTPRGIFPLRYFFTGGTETDDGETVGWDRVKSRVRELVDAENRMNPLKDDLIAAMLKEEGIDISRRTVAKYRQQLNLPAARQRRQFRRNSLFGSPLGVKRRLRRVGVMGEESMWPAMRACIRYFVLYHRSAWPNWR
jgi:RNA polymerase sigma-54 factor